MSPGYTVGSDLSIYVASGIACLLVGAGFLLEALGQWTDIPWTKLISRPCVFGGWSQILHDLLVALLWEVGVLCFAAVGGLVSFHGLPSAGTFAYQLMQSPRHATIGPLGGGACAIALAFLVCSQARRLSLEITERPDPEFIDAGKRGAFAQAKAIISKYKLLVRIALLFAAILAPMHRHFVRRTGFLGTAKVYALLDAWDDSLILEYCHDTTHTDPLVAGAMSTHAATADSTRCRIALTELVNRDGYRATAANLIAFHGVKSARESRKPRRRRCSVRPPVPAKVDARETTATARIVDVCVDGSGLGVTIPWYSKAHARKGDTCRVVVDGVSFNARVIYWKRQSFLSHGRVGLSLATIENLTNTLESLGSRLEPIEPRV